MVRSYKRKTTNKKWSKSVMSEAVATVLAGKMGFSLASRTFSLPKTTLERWVKKARESSALQPATVAAGGESGDQDPDHVDKTSAVFIKYEPEDAEAEWITANGFTAAVVSEPASSTVTTYEMTTTNPPSHNVPQSNNRFHTGEGVCQKGVGEFLPNRSHFAEAVYSPPSNTAHHHHHVQPTLDATEHLFLGFAKTIKTLSARRQILTKMHIAQYILEQELQQHEEEENHHHHHHM